MHQFEIITVESTTKVQQIVQTVRRDIEKGRLKKDTRLPSINDFSDQYNVARDTIEKAYNELKQEGYIMSVAGKGYFVVGKKETKLKILLIFNKLSSYKKIIYDSFLHRLGNKARVDLQIHHYDPRLLKEIIETNLGKYHYYVVMPHFFLNANKKECMRILEMIPENELVILDKKMTGLDRQCIEVYQDFRLDIYNALSSATDLLNKYKRLEILLEKNSNHPREIIEGATQFCREQNKMIIVSSGADAIRAKKGTTYVVTAESDLAVLVKKVRLSGIEPGKEVGIISFNETALKELLGITVVTTDFEAMGKTAADCILQKEIKQVSNPFYMIRRNSL